MARLDVKLLGRMTCDMPDGRRLNLSTRKSEALLAYLAMSPGFHHSRERLVNLFWSDRSEDQARNSLRQALSSLKKGLDADLPGLLEVERTSVSLKPEKIEVDVDAFGIMAADSGIKALTEAVKVYRGEFLEGMVIRDPEGEQWLADERENHKRIYVDALGRLSRLQLDSADFKSSIASAERLVSIDPLDESGWRLLMKAQHLNGNRNHALKAYKRCCDVLQRELGVEPEEVTRELQRQVKTGRAGIIEKQSVLGQVSTELTTRSPGILVLPFENLSNDSEQQYFSDGLTEGIIMGLSLFPSLRVHSRNSSFAADARNMSIREIGEVFDSQFVVEGSVRKSNDKVRITAQLVNIEGGEQLWGQRFDSSIEALFSLEDQVTRSIVSILKGRIELTELENAYRKPANNMQSYDLLMRGRYHLIRFNPKDNRVSIEYLLKCIEIDPDNAAARNDLYRCYVLDWLSAWTAPRCECLDKAGVHIRKAMELEPDRSYIRASYAEYLIFAGEYEQAEANLDRVIKLNPNDTEAIATMSAVHAALGNIEPALELADSCRRLDPFHPWVDWVTGIAYYRARKYEDALKAFCNMPIPADEIDGWIAACYQRLGELDKASRHLDWYLDTARKNMSKLPATLDEWKEIWSSAASFRYQKGVDYPFEALCEAGLKQVVEKSTSNQVAENIHSIAVLPFDNLSGDPEQEYFSDGITESVIINLSLFSGLLVKSRNSSFAFKEQIKSLGEISKELNVNYVVEGSVRKSIDRIRITVQLVEAGSGNQIWGKRYDSDLSNLFDLEEELSRTIAATVTGQIDSDLQRIAISKCAADQKSYDLLLSGKFHCYKFTRIDMVIAQDKLKACLVLDPMNVQAHALLYECHIVNWLERWVVDYKQAFVLAGEYIHRALKLGPEVVMVQIYYAEYLIFCRENEAAVHHVEKVLSINPNNPDALATKAFNLIAIGEYEFALEMSKNCLRLDPYNPWVDWVIAESQLFTGNPSEAIKTILNSKTSISYLKALLVVAYSKTGDEARAKETMQQFLQLCGNTMLSMPVNRDEWIEYWLDNLPYRDTELVNELIGRLMEAGLCDDVIDQSGLMPSIAVLPFENMSGDPDQQFFGDGITTDVISILSRFPKIRTVARHSTLQYRDQRASITDIAQQQNVRYILEGSVRKSGDRIRVSANLIDSEIEENCWSERYDRALDDFFAVQDDITKNIVAAMKVHFEQGDQTLHRANGTRNIKAWELVLNASELQDSYVHQNILEARNLINTALEIDPEYCFAWVSLGWIYWQEAYTGWCESFEDSIMLAENAVDKSLELEPGSGDAWILKGNILILNNQAEAGLEAGKKALELEPGNAEIQMLMAYAYCHIDEFELASEHYRTAMNLCPVCPNWFYLVGGEIELNIGSPDKGIQLIRQSIDVEPDSPLARFYLINALLDRGEDPEARQLAQEIRTLDNSIKGKGLVRMHSQRSDRRKRFQNNLVNMGFEA